MADADGLMMEMDSMRKPVVILSQTPVGRALGTLLVRFHDVDVSFLSQPPADIHQEEARLWQESRPVVILEAGSSHSYGPKIPGLELVPANVMFLDILDAIGAATYLTKAEFRHILVSLWRVRDQVSQHVHEIQRELLAPLPRHPDSPVKNHYSAEPPSSLHQHLDELRNLLSRLGLSAESEIVNLVLAELATADDLEHVDVHGLLRQLENLGDLLRKPEQQLSMGSPDSPPRGLRALLIADDDGYPLESRCFLRQLGYSLEVCLSFDDAREMLLADPRPVFICDMQFGDDPGAGRKLMALAKQQDACKLVIALSGSWLLPHDVPEADQICAGPLAKTETGARRIHELICSSVGEGGG